MEDLNVMSEVDMAYIAGLFDGEGSIHFKRGIEKKKKHKGDGYRYSNSMRISMEITMTDYSVVCLLIWPFAHVKLDKIQQIIEHYSKEKIMNGNVVSLDEYKQAMSLE